MNKQKQCVKCNKNGGILTCDGCERSFCGKHVSEHRQELANQLDEIIQEHDLFQQELGQFSETHLILEKIDKWEIESIIKIQVTAEVARADVRELMKNSKKQLHEECRTIAVTIRSSREADNYSETDLNQWIEKLNALKFEATTLLSSIQIAEDERNTIHLITVTEDNSTKKSDKIKFISNQSTNSIVQERFVDVIGGGKIKDNGTLVTCNTYSDYVYILGQQRYSQGRHTIRFKVEQRSERYNIFFGCVSSKITEKEIHYISEFVVGWFGYDGVWRHAVPTYNTTSPAYKSETIQTDDILHLTFNCNDKQIELFHERTKQRYVVPINIEKAPLPWRLLLVMNQLKDSVRILS